MKLSLHAITFESYSACNLRCVYCYNTWKRPEADAPFRYSHKQALKTLKEHTNKLISTNCRLPAEGLCSTS